MAAPANRRKWNRFLIHTGFQLRLVLGNLIFLISVIAVFCLVLLSTVYYDVKITDSLWSRYASAELLLRLLERGGIMAMVIIVISIGYHIAFSHRLCGPLVNMKHTFEALTEGDATRNVHLRRKDFLKPEAQVINQMLDAVRNRIIELQNSQAEIAVLARELPPGPLENRLQERLKDHQRLLDQWVVRSTHGNPPSSDLPPRPPFPAGPSGE